MRKFIIFNILIFAFATLQVSANSFYNIIEMGADNTGKELNTEVIKNAIAKVAEAGGGTIYFPAGDYLTGPIHMKSNIVLHIEAGATIKFSDNFDHYMPFVPSRWEGTNVNNFSPLIYAYEVENISIIGRGTLDGQRKAWWDFHYSFYTTPDQRSKWQIEFEKQNPDIIKPDISRMVDRGFLRPPFIQFMYCKNIRMEGITIINSPFWTVNPQFSNNIKIDGITILNPRAANTDGINPESCSNVHISNCHISVGDDCITITSGKDRDGLLRNTPSENITITNCTMRGIAGSGSARCGMVIS